MWGSLLSKFRKPNNKVAPLALDNGEPIPGLMKVMSRSNLAGLGRMARLTPPEILSTFSGSRGSLRKASPSNSGRLLQRDIEKQMQVPNAWNARHLAAEREMRAMESAREILALRHPSALTAKCLPKDSGGEDANTLKSAVSALYAPDKNAEKQIAAERDIRALESAREILTFHYDPNSGASSSSTIASQPLTSTRSVLLKSKTESVAFEVLVEEGRPVCPSARLPRRLRQLNCAPFVVEPQAVAGPSRPTARQLAAQQAAAIQRRDEELETRRQAGRRVSRTQNRIAETRSFARQELMSSIERRTEGYEQRREERRNQDVRRRQLREEHSRVVRENVERTQRREEEEEGLAYLDGMEADDTFHASGSNDGAWDDESHKRDPSMSGWDEFFGV